LELPTARYKATVLQGNGEIVGILPFSCLYALTKCSDSVLLLLLGHFLHEVL